MRQITKTFLVTDPWTELPTQKFAAGGRPEGLRTPSANRSGYRTACRERELMAEVPLSGEHHRNAVLVGGCDDLLISH